MFELSSSFVLSFPRLFQSILELSGKAILGLPEDE